MNSNLTTTSKAPSTTGLKPAGIKGLLYRLGLVNKESKFTIQLFDTKLHFKDITNNDEELEKYLSGGQSLWGNVKIPIEYCRQGKAVGIYDDRDELIGGYLLVYDQPFRSIQLIPQNIKDKTGIERLDPTKMMEITAVWLHPKVKSPIQGLHFWTKIIRDANQQKKEYIVFPFNWNSLGLRKLYMHTRSDVIYIANRDGNAGLSSHANVAVVLSTPEKLLWYLLIGSSKKIFQGLFFKKRGIYGRTNRGPTARET